MTQTLPSTPTAAPRVGAAGCIDGLVTVPTADGPEYVACLAPCCTGRRAVQRRIAATGDVFLGAATADDEEI